MKRPTICGSIVNEDLDLVERSTAYVDLFEVRIDLVGQSWPRLVQGLHKPWIACNRKAQEGGCWVGDERSRVEELYRAVDLNADLVDVELATENLEQVVRRVKSRCGCIISFHDGTGTPLPARLKELVGLQLRSGADICKVVTTAQNFDDNLTVLQLLRQFPDTRIVAFAMGPEGVISRILSPLIGGEFAFASLGEGKESAPAQLTAVQLRTSYEMIASGR